MLLIKTTYPNFDEYIKSLSLPARKNYIAAMKRNVDLTYEEVAFNKQEVQKFMALWESQLVRGEKIIWGYTVEHIEKLANKGKLKVFRGGDLACHFIEKKDGYWECHPPMYDKIYSDRYLAKWMWFNLIKYAIEHHMEPLNLGGGPNDWIEHIKNRHKYTNPTYKWAYVPEYTKNNPESEPPYYLTRRRRKLRVKNQYIEKLKKYLMRFL